MDNPGPYPSGRRELRLSRPTIRPRARPPVRQFHKMGGGPARHLALANPGPRMSRYITPEPKGSAPESDTGSLQRSVSLRPGEGGIPPAPPDNHYHHYLAVSVGTLLPSGVLLRMHRLPRLPSPMNATSLRACPPVFHLACEGSMLSHTRTRTVCWSEHPGPGLRASRCFVPLPYTLFATRGRPSRYRQSPPSRA